MTLEYLKLHNFKRYPSFEIAFEDGLYGILGRNGSGKSTIFEAVFFALYGEYKGNKELLPTVGSEGGVKVDLRFTVDEKSYIVSREFRGKNLVAYAKLEEGGESLVSGAKEVTGAVTKLLGIGKEAFLRTVFASQKELTALSSMKNEDRKAMMRRLLGLEKIDAIEGMIRDELRDLNRDIKAAESYLLDEATLKQHENDRKAKNESAAALQATIKTLTEEAAKLKAAHEAAKTAVETQQKAKEARAKKQESLERAKQTLASHEEQRIVQEKELTALRAESERYTQQLPLKTQLETLEKSLADQETRKANFLKKEGLEKAQAQLREEFKSRTKEIVELTKAIEPLPTIQERFKVEQTALTKAKETLQKLDDEIAAHNATIASNRAAIAKVAKQVETITALGRESACPTCTRPLLEQYDTVLDSLNKEITDVYQKAIDVTQKTIDTLAKERTEKQKMVAEAEKQAADTDKQIALLQSKTADLQKAQVQFKEVETRGLSNKAALDKLGIVTYDEHTHEALKKEHQTLKPQVEALLKLEALIATIPAKSEALETLKKSIEADKKALAEAEKELKADSYSEKAHTDAITQAAKTEADKDAHAAKLHAVTLDHANILRDIEAIDKELKRNDTQKAALAGRIAERNDYDKLKALMAEFKTHVNARITPRIGEVASEMYSRITRGKYQHIEVSPEFDFFIYDNGERFPIERFSGGEIDLANLVLRIAISKTLGELSGGGNIGFLAFDEVFGSQDEERRLRIMEAFHTISESYRQIFLISHETEIKEMFEKVVEL